MSEHNASPYFTERARQSWRTLGYGGMAFPFLATLHAPDPVVALTTTAFVIPSILNLVASHRERLGDKLPDSIAHIPGQEERRELGNFTFRCLLDRWKAELSFEDMVTEAISCSNEFGRRSCVIYLHMPDLAPMMRDFVANLLRENVRGTDEVAAISDNEFVVCAPLLRDALATDIVLKRLIAAVADAEVTSPTLRAHFGKAIHPMNGYTGAELIAHARNDAKVAA
jgi:hypothetical protein